MSWVIKFPLKEFANLRSLLLADSSAEAGAVLFCNRGPSQLLVDDIWVPQSEDIQSATAVRLELTPSFVARTLKRARETGHSLVFVHTHPQSHFPQFSPVDDAGEKSLMRTFLLRAPNRPHAFLVIGREGFDGRVHVSGSSVEPISRAVDVGKDIKWTSSTSSGLPEQLDLSIYDRSIRAFGAEGQMRLRQLRAGIVGLGGTGSIVAEQLAHLGVGSIKLLDRDIIETTNLNRVVGATSNDVGEAKVVTSARLISTISDGSVDALPRLGDVLNRSDAEFLLDCDFLFCCTDNHGSRAALVQLAYQYLVPMIDMGVQIDTSHGHLGAMSGRVQMMAPGLACLQCRQLLDPEAVRRDFMDETSRRADPYITGMQEPQPAVISLNGTVASLAVTMFLSAVVGVAANARSLIYRIGDGIVKPTGFSPVEDCVICSQRGAFAKGDTWPLLTR